MKIGILTFHFSKNYGAIFQATALRQYLLSRGYEVSFVNYRPEGIENINPFLLSNLVNKKKFIINFYNLFRHIYANIFQKTLSQAFADYQAKFLKADIELGCMAELDAVIVGSDQVWRPTELGEIDPVYLMNVQSFTGRKISYAASVGSHDFSADVFDKLIQKLENFDRVSVREEELAEIARSKGFSNVDVVLDPTFLVDWRDFISNANIDQSTHEQNYIFSYYLRSKDGIEQLNKQISEFTDLGVITPKGLNNRIRYLGTPIQMSPIEWLNYAYRSKVITTNTFHGVAMSVVLNKNFWFAPLGGVRASLNVRSLNLLNDLGLENRIWTGDNNFSEEIDWDSLNRTLESKRIHSKK